MLLMYPEDRVLVVYVPQQDDFARIEREGWYRIPLAFAPKGLYAEYFAFYFGRPFGAEKWAIHYYAPTLGHELFRRRDLLPEEADHPRADKIYYKVQLGPLQRLERPIVSLRWRRITFIHTTWDRFQDAREINDLFVEGEPYVDRRYAILRDQEGRRERDYRAGEQGSRGAGERRSGGAEESRGGETGDWGLETGGNESEENPQSAIHSPQSEGGAFTIDGGGA